MNKNPLITKRDSAFDHMYRQYMIGCAEHVIHLTSVPEFTCALALLKIYDAEPTKANKDRLAKLYKALVAFPELNDCVAAAIRWGLKNESLRGAAPKRVGDEQWYLLSRGCRDDGSQRARPL
jgi:hypothetical protein